MAPTPASEAPPVGSPTSTPSKGGSLATIISIVIFSIFASGALAIIVLYVIYRKKRLAKLPSSHRPTSYRPFRTNSSKSKSDLLLPNAAPVSEADDKSSMFSRDRSSSTATITLYVPEEHEYRRASMEAVSLIPLRITPAEEETEDPMNRVSSLGSSRYSRTTTESPVSALSPSGASLAESRLSQDLGIKPNRPRRSSTNSVRYYDSNSTPTEPAPTVPRIPSR